MIKHLPNLRSAHFQGASILILGTVIAQAINLVSSPFITRLFSPSDFGQLSLYGSFIAPLVIVATWRLDTALVISRNVEERLSLKQFIYRISLIACGVVGLVVVASAFFAPAQQLAWAWLLPMGLFFTTAAQVENADRNYRKDYVKISRARVFQAIVMATVSIGIGYLWHINLGLVVATLIGNAVCWAYLGQLRPMGGATARPLSAADVTRDYSRYLYFASPASLLDIISQQTPVFVLSYFLGQEITGHYGLALKVLILPTHLVGGAVAQVFLKRFSELWEDRNANLKLSLVKTWASLFALGFVPFGLLLVYGRELFVLVFGSPWASAGDIASLIAPMLFANFISGPSSSALIVQNNHSMSLLYGAIALVIRVGSLFYGAYVGEIFLGFRIWVVLEILSMVAYNVTIWRAVSKRNKAMGL